MIEFDGEPTVRAPLPEVPCFLCGTLLIAGPRGGMSVNMGCPRCLTEFVVPIWRGEVIEPMVETMIEPLTGARAMLYGIKAKGRG